MKIKEIITWGYKQLEKEEDGKLKAKLLLAFFFDVTKEYFTVHAEEIVPEEIEEKYREGIEKLKQGIPLQYLRKKQEFMGFTFYVDERVLIPQPDTEILVETAIENIRQRKQKVELLDLCTGSGAIGISIAKLVPSCSVILSDISKDALEVAKKNAENLLENKIEIRESNFFEKIPEKFDYIVSNPPYIKTKVVETLSKEVRKEPILALDGGSDGLDAYRSILQESAAHLKTNGMLLLEIGYDQKEEVLELIRQTKQYKAMEVKQDLAGNDRVILAKKGETKDVFFI